MLDFTSLVIGNKYERAYLTELWGYAGRQAISRGVITPKNENNIILFITKKKQGSATQYADNIEQDILFWEGEKEHGNDLRITQKRDTIHVFYREVHHSSFIYKGRAILQFFKLYTDRPSKFTFQLIDQKVTVKNLVEEIRMTYGMPETEKEAIIKSRRGQGIYRSKSIELWKTCSVTGFTKSDILIASHIKPWKISVNAERVDHFNSLLLVPSLDKLFDRGYIGFESSGKIIISDKISKQDFERIGLNKELRLRNVPSETKSYLMYHQEYRFDILEK